MSSEVMSSRLPRNSAGDTWDVTQAASAAVATRPANDIDLIFRIRPPGKERSFHIRSYKRYPGRASPFAVPQPPSGGRPTTLVSSPPLAGRKALHDSFRLCQRGKARIAAFPVQQQLRAGFNSSLGITGG